MKYRALSLFVLFFFTSSLAIVSCSDDADDNAPCTGAEVAGLDVFVTDATTTLPINEGVNVEVVEGSFQTNLTFIGSGHYIGLYDQQGSYTITVSKPGYQTYTEDNVAVFKPGCHPLTTSRAVALQPE